MARYKRVRVPQAGEGVVVALATLGFAAALAMAELLNGLLP